MPDRDPRRYLAWGVAVVGLALLSAWYVARSRPSAAAVAPPVATIAMAGDDPRSGGRLTVDVSGAVRRPGVYSLAAGSRVNDALKRAGGTTARADVSQVNRAAKLQDGRQVLVPSIASAGTAGAAPSAVGASSSQPLDLNTATLEQLDTLDGVGPATAQKILDFRTTHGGFGSVEELDQIPGIGAKKLEAMRAQVRV